jgi:hypothetical protein
MPANVPAGMLPGTAPTDPRERDARAPGSFASWHRGTLKELPHRVVGGDVASGRAESPHPGLAARPRMPATFDDDEHSLRTIFAGTIPHVPYCGAVVSIYRQATRSSRSSRIRWLLPTHRSNAARNSTRTRRAGDDYAVECPLIRVEREEDGPKKTSQAHTRSQCACSADTDRAAMWPTLDVLRQDPSELARAIEASALLLLALEPLAGSSPVARRSAPTAGWAASLSGLIAIPRGAWVLGRATSHAIE